MQDRNLTLPRLFENSAESSSPITIVERHGRTSRLRADLLSQAERVAGGLLAANVRPRDRVGVVADTTFDFIVSCLAVWKMGAAVVSLPGSDGRGASSSLPSPDRFLLSAGVDALIADPSWSARTSLQVLNVDHLSRAAPHRGSEPAPEDEALVQSSSGSTGNIKGVSLSHRALAGYITTVGKYLAPAKGAGRGFVSWLPLHHDLGFVNYLLYPLATADPLILMPPALFIRDPLNWVREIAHYQAAVSAAPNFAYGLLARKLQQWEGDAFDLSSWRLAGIGGEQLDPDLLQRFADIAKDHGFDALSLCPGYGLAEATCAVTIGARTGIVVDHVDRAALREGRAQPSRQGEGLSVASVGPPLPGSEVRVIDSSGRRLPDRSLGEIIVKSPFLMEGYVLPEGAETDEAGIGGDGWLRTGDRGYLVGDDLFVTGRIKDLIIVHGRNHHAEEIEGVVTSLDGVRPGGCVAFPAETLAGPDRLVIMVETDRSSSDDRNRLISAIRNAVSSRVGIVPSEVMLVDKGMIPKTTSGKLRRRFAKRLHAEGEAWSRSGTDAG